MLVLAGALTPALTHPSPNGLVGNSCRWLHRPQFLLRSSIVCSEQQQPELDERQAAIMKAQGYAWDPERRRWFRGDPSTRVRRAAECRSGSRCARFVNADGSTAACGPAVCKGIRELEGALQVARDAALGTDEDETRAFNLELKDTLAAPWAPYAWAAAQVGGGLLLAQAASAQGVALWPASLEATMGSVLLGLAAAPPLVIAHRRLRKVHAGAGVEGSAGQLERLLADSAIGSHALPSPWEFRLDEASASWRRLALLFELVATSNVNLALHGVLQPSACRAFSMGAEGPPGAPAAAVALILLASLPAVSEAYFFGDPLLDGLPAELAECERLSRGAESLFLMKAAPSAGPQEAAASAEALRSLAAGWSARFGAEGASVANRATDAALAAAATVALTGLAWQLSGGESMLAPLLANAVATADAYLWSADPEAARASVKLPEACTGL